MNLPLRAAAACAMAAVGALGCPAPPPLCNTVVCDAIPTGSAPNAVALSTCDGDPVAIVTASGDARLDTFSITDHSTVASVHFDLGADPWAIAVDEASHHAVVTLRGTDALVAVDPCTGDVLLAGTVGSATTSVHLPQPIIFDGTRYIVGFTNVVHDSTGPGDLPVLDPGVVAAFTFESGAFVPGPSVVLPCKNPQGLALDGDHVWASCSGPLGADGGGTETATEDGALVELDANLTVLRSITAGRHAPGTPAILGNDIYAGSIVKPDLLVGAVDGVAVDVGLTLDGPAVDSVFAVRRFDDHTLIATQFSQDSLRIIETGGAAPVLRDSVAVGPGGPAFHGLLDVDIRPGFGDIDGVALLTLSSEVVPLRLHALPSAAGTTP